MLRYGFVAGLLSVVAGVTANAASVAEQWPQWRGPNADGVAVKGDPPITWSETENVKWKIALPGHSSSTPIIWEDKLFIQTAVPADGSENALRHRGAFKFNVICYNRNSGEVIWEKTAVEATPHEGHHPTGSHASYSPVTDGERLWVSFGSRGLYCFDLDGNLEWKRDLIEMRMRRAFGEGSSPAIAGDAVVVQMDHEGDSKIFAFNKISGEPMWQANRNEISSWSTPLAVEHEGKYQVVTTATDKIRSYDAATGEVIWECEGLTANAIPTPIAGFGMVYCTSGFRGYAMRAIELGHTGDLTGTDALKWEVDEGTPYVPSPLLYGDRLYVTSDNRAILSCYDAKTGEAIFTGERLEGLGQLYASPVGAADRIYIADRDGNTLVLKRSDKVEVLALNKLDDVFDPSPVVIGDTIYLKGLKNLYCISAN